MRSDMDELSAIAHRQRTGFCKELGILRCLGGFRVEVGSCQCLWLDSIVLSKALLVDGRREGTRAHDT